MTILPYALGISLIAITISMLLCLFRMVMGPSIVDRLLALDTLFLNATCLIIVLGIYWTTTSLFEGALLVAMLGFVSTAAFSSLFYNWSCNRLGKVKMQITMEIIVSIFLVFGAFYVSWIYRYGTSTRFIHATTCTYQVEYIRLR